MLPNSTSLKHKDSISSRGLDTNILRSELAAQLMFVMLKKKYYSTLDVCRLLTISIIYQD